MRFKDVLLVEKYLMFAFNYIWERVLIRETFAKMMIDERLYIHSMDVCKLSTQMAITAGYEDTVIRRVCVAGLLHDIGKTQIPKEILYKKAQLTSEEFDLIKTHSKLGYDILTDVCEDETICQMVLKHHEKITGDGYPFRLTEKTDLEEIVTVADMFCAMTEPRVYHEERNLYEVYGFMCQSNELKPKILQILSDSILFDDI